MSLDERFRDITWRNEPDEIEQWKQGETGCPIVDAAMRRLVREGRMHTAPGWSQHRSSSRISFSTGASGISSTLRGPLVPSRRRGTGVELGRTYPYPLVDQARQRAIAAYETARGTR